MSIPIIEFQSHRTSNGCLITPGEMINWPEIFYLWIMWLDSKQVPNGKIRGLQIKREIIANITTVALMSLN